MSKLTKKTLLKHLNRSDKEDLIREVITLFDKFKNVKEFYAAELSNEANPVLEKYKRKIRDIYALPNPKERSTNLNLNKLLTEFKKISIYERDTVDLMIHRVECGVDALKHNSKRSITFYNSILATFEQAIKLIEADNYSEEFRDRISRVIKDSEVGKFGMTERMAEIAIGI